jgi:hypothetical protein
VRGLGTVNDDDLSDVAVTSTTGWSVFLGANTGATNYVPLANIRDINSAGDVNGDGRADLIVATWLFRVGQNALHVTNVHHGGSAGMATSPARTYTESLPSNDAAASGIDDVNGDGYGDVVVAAQGTMLRVYSGGAAGAGATSVDIRVTGWAHGDAVASAGDTNGDLRDDMIVGFPDSGCEFSGSFAVRIYRGGASAISVNPQQINAPDTQCSDFGVTVAWARPAHPRLFVGG